jgi:hypothetical protein
MIRAVRVEENCGSWDVIGTATIFHVFTCFAHVWYATAGKGYANHWRWWEYTISAPLVFAQLAVTCGTRQQELLLAIIALVAAAMPLGLLLEKDYGVPAEGAPLRARQEGTSVYAPVEYVAVESQDKAVRCWPFSCRRYAWSFARMTSGVAASVAWFGVAAALGLTLKMYVEMAHAAPNFVHALVACQIAFLTSFGVVGTVVACSARSIPKAWEEVTYTSLSFVSKFVPTTIFLGAIMES